MSAVTRWTALGGTIDWVERDGEKYYFRDNVQEVR